MALSRIDQRFMNDPLTFMKTVTVQPQDYKDRGTGATSLYDQKPHSYNTDAPKAQFDSMLTVQGHGNLVAYTKLSEADGAGMKNHYNLFFYSKSVASTSSLDNYIPCYFLPWTSDHLTKIKIPPKIPSRTGVSDTTRRLSDPDIFFTAAINGCSVFAVGDPKSPTVYHAGTTEGRSNLSNPNPFIGGNARLHWTDVFEQNRSGVGGYGAIHKGDYVNTAGTSTTPEATMYKQFLESTAQTEMRIDSVTPEGSIFGLRDPGGNWSFYLQKNIKCVFTRLKKQKKGITRKTVYVPETAIRNKGFSNEEVYEVTQRVWMPVQLIKFFPGNGKSIESARLEPSQVKFVLDAYR